MSADAPLSDPDRKPRQPPSLRGQTPHDHSTPGNRGPGNLTEPVTPRTSTDATTAHPTDVVERLPAVAGYDVLGLLGRGGMGAVYKARDRSLERTVALKMLRPGRGLSPSELERFRREARALARLDHANVIPIYSEGECDGWPYFTMKLMAGGSLARHLADYHGDPVAAATLIEKVARAVHYLHGMNILHRDLKPLNILLDDQGEPSVSDFGIAKLVDDDLELTVRGSVLGTRPYMAPEQAAGRNEEVGPAADVWALGVVLYELVAGRRPFVGDTDQAITHAILKTDPPTPRTLRPELNADLETIALKCLRKEPAGRYASAEALADDLARWRNNEPITARPESVLRKGRRAVRRHPAVAAAVVLLTVAGVVAAAVAPYFDPDRPFRETERKLARQEAVVLIGEKGPPVHSRWAAGYDGRTTSPAGGPFTVEGELALLRLATLPPGQSFRLRAEIQLDVTSLGCAGLFFGLRRLKAPPGPEVDGCVSVTFNDCRGMSELAPNRAAPPFWLKTTFDLLEREVNGREVSNVSQLGMQPFTGAPFVQPAAPRPWHALAVVVAPAGLSVFWDDLKPTDFPNETIDPIIANTARPPDRELARAWLRRDGPSELGIICRRATASFRNCILEPVPDNP